jgi:MFS transporter, SP family, general alpha glucoside:H+ symporter
MLESRRSSSVTASRDNDGVLRVNDDAFHRLSEANANLGQEQSDAKLANDNEKSLSIMQAIRLYKKAICYSLIMSLAVVMEGYDAPLRLTSY